MAGIWRNLERNKKALNDMAKSDNLLFLDVETTGLSKNREIIELAMIGGKFRNGRFERTSAFDAYVRPSMPISDKITEITGITNEFLSDKPTEAELFPIIERFAGTRPFVCAYNAKFDVDSVSAAYERNGRKFETSGVVDLLPIMRDALCLTNTKDMKLKTVAETYGVENGVAFHDAFDDARVLLRLANAYVHEARFNSNSENDLPARATRLYYSDGFRGNRRLYVDTSAGRMYYSFRNDKWIPAEEGLDLRTIRMDMIERDVFAIAGCSNYKELDGICKKRGKGVVE